LRIIEIYIINSQLTDKRKIISTLARSLLGLAPSALILNLCTIVKPIFSQSNYTANYERNIENNEEKDNENVKQIKVKIENWIKDLKLQPKDLKKIDDLKKKVNKQVSKYAREFKLKKDSDDFSKILKEAQDMLDITLTAISLATNDENKKLYKQLFPS
jgi:tRNA-dihydrouridine synthase